MAKETSERTARAPSTGRQASFRFSEQDFASQALQLLPVWPKDLRDRTPSGRRKLIAIIEREVRKERRRGIAGDRAYDIMRHAKLARLLRAERQSFLTLACLKHQRSDGRAAKRSTSKA